MNSPRNERLAVDGKPNRLWQTLLIEARGQPWLLRLLGEHGAALYLRFRAAYARLGQLRSGQLRRLQGRLGVGLAGAALLLALSGGLAYGAPSASITVDAGGVCTLAEAIASANNDNAAGNGCVNGSGPDTITLQTDVGLTSALPNITSPITIAGNGHTISRSSGSFGILTVVSGGNLTLNSATLSGGSASSGGGIYAKNATVTVQNSTLSGNSASYGGGIFASSATVTVQNSTLSSNSVFGGGGIFAGSSTVTVQNSTLSGNLAARGGGIRALSSMVIVQNSSLSGNTAHNGGGIQVASGSVTVQNSTLSGNFAGYGGGIFVGDPFLNTNAAASVQSSTLSGNSASYSSGGIFVRTYAATTVQNSIVAGQIVGSDCGGSGAKTSYGYNLESGTSCGFTSTGDLQNTNPKLSALSGGVMKPQNDSPAIDAGNPTTPGSGGAACLATDQRGQARNDLRCDIGAVEVKLTDTDTVIKNVSGPGTFTFGPTLAKIVVTAQGSLSQLSVQHHAGNHPNATRMNGQWWRITPTGAGFTANLNLPHTVSPDANAKVCKHVSGAIWDCARTGSDAGRVWSDGVTTFSDWAVGDNVSPNAISLLGFTAIGGGSGLMAGLLAMLAALAGLGLGLRRRLVVRGQRSEVGRQGLRPCSCPHLRCCLNSSRQPPLTALQPSCSGGCRGSLPARRLPSTRKTH